MSDSPNAPRNAPRSVPRWATVLLLAMVGLVIVAIAVVAAQVGPLEAHPPTSPPDEPVPPSVRSPASKPVLSSMDKPILREPDGTWLWWVAGVFGGLIALFLVFALVRALRQWRYRMARPPAMAAPASTTGLSVGWATSDPVPESTDDRTFDPERAADDIIASWTVVEAASVQLGYARKRASTPTEFVAALVERFGDPLLHDDGSGERAAEALLHLYHRARFDLTALQPDAALTARAAVRRLLKAWKVTETVAPPAHPASTGQHR